MSDYDNLVKPLMLNHKNVKEGLVSVIPEGCVLPISDKGLGPVLLPYDWFVREYRHQAVLGGHEIVLSSEGALLVKLFSIIADFRSALTVLEGALFTSIYKYSGNDFKLAALKIIPKIPKLSHPISPSFIEFLPSQIHHCLAFGLAVLLMDSQGLVWSSFGVTLS